MNLTEYIDGCKRTESGDNPLTDSITSKGLSHRVLHGIIGISTEVGEMVQAYERTNIDFVNLAEEVGDAYWYTGVIFDELDILRVDAPELDAIPADQVPKQLVSLSADMLDRVKKVLFYGKKATFDLIAFEEEITRFYVLLGLYVDGLKVEVKDLTKEKIWEVNLTKLKIRYPEKFDMTDAQVRDLEAERVVLESIK